MVELQIGSGGHVPFSEIHPLPFTYLSDFYPLKKFCLFVKVAGNGLVLLSPRK